ncbi:kelch repeat-containing protein [Corallococcus llansteffanensis]|uniref:Kelch-like protein n=1 Tax=Corallococcus llansteffanensis TaxID=2316731 RepID=A0A3A8QHU0_9BACT|nr:kelch repeat-containing protein [Corallococcus llansteffanensis]RKH68266.1 hypothetical protein D7V93_01490 [Corallococcus llansteffanensis]
MRFNLTSARVAGIRRQFLVQGAVLLGALAWMSCAPTEPSNPPPVPEVVNTSLFLKIQSVTGEPVPQAQLRLDTGKSAQSNTPGPRFKPDAHGQVLLEDLPPGKHLLQVEAPGFVSTFMALALGERVQAGSGLQLMPLGEPVATFDTSQGARFERGGIQVTVHPGGPLMDAEGLSIEGQVEAFFVPVDLENGGLQGAPGMQQGLIQPDAPPVSLESLGMFALVFKQKGPGIARPRSRVGEVSSFARRIEIGGGLPRSIRANSLKEPELSCRVSALAETPRPVPLWRPDWRSGFWVPLGETCFFMEDRWQCSLGSSPPPLIQVALPFWWRSTLAAQDNPLQAPEPAWVETGCVAVRLVQKNGQPVAGRMVMAQGVDYVSISRALTNGEGLALLEVMRGREFRVEASAKSTSLVVSEAGTCQEEGAPPTAVTLWVATQRCTPGTARDCAYSGPSDRVGQGICRPAKRYCDTEGAGWSDSCVGEVLPQPERCENALDDNCDGSIDEGCPRCQEGERRSCYQGPDNSQDVGQCQAGAQQCLAGGVWSACEGEVLPEVEDCSWPDDENCDGVACQCWPGITERCYSGPPGTAGVGVCLAGTRTCDNSGTWGACTEVRPQAESCGNALDDDCDGQVDEECSRCEPGTARPCYSGPAGTAGVGECRAGAQTCNAAGTSWGTCSEEVLPRTEDCTNPLDDNCDGRINEKPPCAWAATSSMISPRIGHVAALLDNGMVLIAGGAYTGRLQTAEKYDPSTRSWSSAGLMTSARDDHTATLLSNGKVLVTGGYSGSSYLRTADLYDPTTNTWSSVSPMTEPRKTHTATRLSNGKVLASGGNGNGYTSSTETYDPVANSWSPLRFMSSARGDHTATLLRDGRVLVTGGYDGNSRLKTAELYDPGTDSWSSAGSMTSARSDHTATLLSDGKVLITGGYYGSQTLDTAELYDPGTDSWSSAGSMTSARSDHTATLLSDGKVLITGGATSLAAELYDPVASTWSSAGTMLAIHDGHTATLMDNGQVLISGAGGAYWATTEVYSP